MTIKNQNPMISYAIVFGLLWMCFSLSEKGTGALNKISTVRFERSPSTYVGAGLIDLHAAVGKLESDIQAPNSNNTSLQTAFIKPTVKQVRVIEKAMDTSESKRKDYSLVVLERVTLGAIVPGEGAVINGHYTRAGQKLKELSMMPVEGRLLNFKLQKVGENSVVISVDGHWEKVSL